MNNNILSSLVTISKGLHRDNRPEREYQILLSNLKLNPIAENGVFKLNFKRPLNSKKQYYQKLIFNQTETEILSFVTDFPQNATIHENKYTYTVLSNKFDKYLNDISSYFRKRAITDDINNDDNYIIHYLKVSTIRLYAELQEQYGQYSENELYTIRDIAEKYFNDAEFDESLFEKINAPKKKVIHKPLKPSRKPKTSFGFKSNDTAKLLTVLRLIHLKIDLLQNQTSVEQFHKLLISEDFTQLNIKIYLQCETTQFSYLVSQMKRHFTNFNPTTIERSDKFITKTGVELKGNNLHKNKVYNPKAKEEIDKIIQQLQ